MTANDLKNLGACCEAIVWVGARDVADCWPICERGDWMIWLAKRVDVDERVVTLAKCGCARLALPYARGDAARIAIETAEAWTRGEATIEQLRRAAAVAHDASTAESYASEAAYGAADAAYSAYSAASVASAAACAADAAFYADASDTTKPKTKTLAECADIVRKYISWEMVAAAYKEMLR